MRRQQSEGLRSTLTVSEPQRLAAALASSLASCSPGSIGWLQLQVSGQVTRGTCELLRVRVRVKVKVKVKVGVRAGVQLLKLLPPGGSSSSS